MSLSRVGEESRESMTHEAWWSRVNGSNFGRFTVSSTLWYGRETLPLLSSKLLGHQWDGRTNYCQYQWGVLISRVKLHVSTTRWGRKAETKQTSQLHPGQLFSPRKMQQKRHPQLKGYLRVGFHNTTYAIHQWWNWLLYRHREATKLAPCCVDNLTKELKCLC